MCLRTFTTDGEEIDDKQCQCNEPQVKNKFTKAKVKYMKKYDEMTKEEHVNVTPEIKDDDAPIKTDMLGQSTVLTRFILNIILKYHGALQNSTLYK